MVTSNWSKNPVSPRSPNEGIHGSQNQTGAVHPYVNGLVLNEQMDLGHQRLDDVASDSELRFRRSGEVDAAKRGHVCPKTNGGRTAVE